MKRLSNRHSAVHSVEGTSVLPRAVGRRQSSFWRRPWVLISIAVAALLFLLLSIVLASRDANVAEQETDTTQAQLGAVADPLAELCRTDPSIRARVGDAACGLAQQAVDDPEIPAPGPQGEAGAPGLDGEPGAEGRGIVSTSLVDGDLVINYSDGSRSNVGRVVGPQGSQGVDGVGITGSSIEEGRLILTFSDGSSRDVGQVVGPAGEAGAAGADGSPGTDGSDGRGVASVDLTDGRLTVVYTDGEVQDVGPVPAGPTGPPGENGSPAETMVLEGAGPGFGDLTCTRSNDDPVSPVYTCS